MEQLFIEDLGFDSERQTLRRSEGGSCFELFQALSLEWMWHEEFSIHLKLEMCNFIEPMWKMMLSNKGLLPVLWELYPGHPNLLPAYFTAEAFAAAQPASGHVRKPKLSREGANVSIIERGSTVAETEGSMAPRVTSTKPSPRLPSLMAIIPSWAYGS